MRALVAAISFAAAFKLGDSIYDIIMDSDKRDLR